MTQWRNHVFRPCHFLAVDRKHKCVAVRVRVYLEWAQDRKHVGACWQRHCLCVCVSQQIQLSHPPMPTVNAWGLCLCFTADSTESRLGSVSVFVLHSRFN